MQNGNRTRPRYDPAIWNVRQRVLDHNDRTNNYSEAAHRKLQRAFGCTKPSIWRFIDIMREQQKAVDTDFAACQQGRDPEPKSEKYIDADRRILNLVQNYQPIDLNANHDHQYQIPQNPNLLIDFLKGISYNYVMDPWSPFGKFLLNSFVIDYCYYFCWFFFRYLKLKKYFFSIKYAISHLNISSRNNPRIYLNVFNIFIFCANFLF